MPTECFHNVSGIGMLWFNKLVEQLQGQRAPADLTRGTLLHAIADRRLDLYALAELAPLDVKRIATWALEVPIRQAAQRRPAVTHMCFA
jgi:hypothetical protein